MKRTMWCAFGAHLMDAWSVGDARLPAGHCGISISCGRRRYRGGTGGYGDSCRLISAAPHSQVETRTDPELHLSLTRARAHAHSLPETNKWNNEYRSACWKQLHWEQMCRSQSSPHMTPSPLRFDEQFLESSLDWSRCVSVMKNRREYVEYWSAILVSLFWIHSSVGMPHVIRIGKRVVNTEKWTLSFTAFMTR